MLYRLIVWMGLALTVMGPTTALAVERQDARSPDGTLTALVKPATGEPGASGQPATSLWLRNNGTGQSRELFHGRASDDPKRNTSSLSNPHFSLDGGYVYVEADVYATGPAIQQVNVRTGSARYVTGGALYGVLRNGPWRGFLVVEQHLYRADGNGSYDPYIVLKPDGQRVATIPGTDGRNPEQALTQWLEEKKWQAD